MLKKFTKHLAHFTPLIGILIFTAGGYFVFSYDKLFQAVIIISASISYVVWGLIHHHMHDEVHISIILEYVAIAFLGLVVGLSMILSA